MKQYFGPNQQGARRSPFKSYAVVLLLMIVFFGGWYVGRGRTLGAEGASDRDVKNVGLVSSVYKGESDFSLFWDVWEDIQQNFVDQPVDDVDLFYGAMQGLVNAVGDPYSDFFDPETAAAFDEELAGSFTGIGVEIGIKNDQLVVIAPLEGSPGDLAGLRAGDAILAVNEQETFQMSLDQAVSLIRGEEGTDVTLVVLSSGAEEPRNVVITRATIDHIGMRWEYLENNIVHVKLASFNQDTENLFNQLVREIQSRDVKGIVLDMRNNPGGFLDMSIEVSSEWVEDGVIVRERDHNGDERLHHARGRARLADIPTVVLINQGSASASEIVAGALQDYGSATLIGETTFGKGSVQKYQNLEDGSSYRLTVAKWFTPQDRAIDEEGIHPDEVIELTDEDFNNDLDPQLERALELLQQRWISAQTYTRLVIG